jgi:hypothetical protein
MRFEEMLLMNLEFHTYHSMKILRFDKLIDPFQKDLDYFSRGMKLVLQF